MFTHFSSKGLPEVVRFLIGSLGFGIGWGLGPKPHLEVSGQLLQLVLIRVTFIHGHH
jgi:hypothetical protein